MLPPFELIQLLFSFYFDKPDSPSENPYFHYFFGARDHTNNMETYLNEHVRVQRKPPVPAFLTDRINALLTGRDLMVARDEYNTYIRGAAEPSTKRDMVKFKYELAQQLRDAYATGKSSVITAAIKRMRNHAKFQTSPRVTFKRSKTIQKRVKHTLSPKRMSGRRWLHSDAEADARAARRQVDSDPNVDHSKTSTWVESKIPGVFVSIIPIMVAASYDWSVTYYPTEERLEEEVQTETQHHDFAALMAELTDLEQACRAWLDLSKTHKAVAAMLEKLKEEYPDMEDLLLAHRRSMEAAMEQLQSSDVNSISGLVRISKSLEALARDVNEDMKRHLAAHVEQTKGLSEALRSCYADIDTVRASIKELRTHNAVLADQRETALEDMLNRGELHTILQQVQTDWGSLRLSELQALLTRLQEQRSKLTECLTGVQTDVTTQAELQKEMEAAAMADMEAAGDGDGEEETQQQEEVYTPITHIHLVPTMA